jgi:hypothetical protein
MVGGEAIMIRIKIMNRIAMTVRDLGYRFNKPKMIIWGMTHIAFEIPEE